MTAKSHDGRKSCVEAQGVACAEQESWPLCLFDKAMATASKESGYARLGYGCNS